MNKSHPFNYELSLAEDAKNLINFAREIINLDSLDKALNLLLGKTVRFFSPSLTSLILPKKKNEGFIYRLVFGEHSQRITNLRLGQDEGVASWVFNHESPLLLTEANLDPRISPQIASRLGSKIQSILSVPFRTPIKTIGVIELINTSDKDPFTPSQLKLLEAIADLTGLAVERIYLQNKLRQQARLDPLTQVYNRSYFEQVLTREIERSQRYNLPLALILLDIKEFKKINEEYGHQAGDNLLKSLACLLVEQVRKVDSVFRLGEDEFAILLPHTNEEGARLVQQRLEQALAEAHSQKKILPIQLTVGLHSASGGEEAGDLFARADIDLFQRRGDDLSSSKEGGDIHQLLLPLFEDEENSKPSLF
jgi:diguanylate cyclase (GGDEF)-like protein